MSDARRQTRSHLMGVFDELKLHPRGDLGQNFLIDLNVLDYVVQQAELSRTDVVLEIGSGTGGMTAFLGAGAAAVVTVEVDRHMAGLAREAIKNYENVTLLNCDALKNKNHFHPDVIAAVQTELAKDPRRRLKLVANLPYSIATPVVSNLVASDLPWERMIVTIQLELAQRMAAAPGKSSFGALSAWLQSQCFVKVLKRLPPSVFWPRPAVNSAVIRLTPAPGKSGPIANRVFFQDFLRRLFVQRRKFMRSVIVGMYRKQLEKAAIDDILDRLGHSANTRAETLEPYQLLQISNQIYDAIQASSGHPPHQASTMDAADAEE